MNNSVYFSPEYNLNTFFKCEISVDLPLWTQTSHVFFFQIIQIFHVSNCSFYQSHTKTVTRMIFVFSAYHILSTSACHPSYEYFIAEFCLSKFSLDMEALDQRLWCSWEDTVE